MLAQQAGAPRARSKDIIARCASVSVFGEVLSPRLAAFCTAMASDVGLSQLGLACLANQATSPLPLSVSL